MLPILVLALATSALAAPGVMNIRQVDSNSVPNQDRSPIGLFYDLYDDGDVMVNELGFTAALKDLGKSGSNQALANGVAVAVFGEVATGNPGDACVSANLVNQYARYITSGNAGAVKDALRGYIQSYNAKIDNIVAFVNNKDSARFASGSKGGCPNGGRTYQFDTAWDVILGSATPNQSGYINELYCAAKRMYCGFASRPNIVAASATAAALPPTQQVFKLAARELASFVASAGGKGNVAQAGRSLKQALSNAVGRVNL